MTQSLVLQLCVGMAFKMIQAWPCEHPVVSTRESVVVLARERVVVLLVVFLMSATLNGVQYGFSHGFNLPNKSGMGSIPQNAGTEAPVGIPSSPDCPPVEVTRDDGRVSDQGADDSGAKLAPRCAQTNPQQLVQARGCPKHGLGVDEVFIACYIAEIPPAPITVAEMWQLAGLSGSEKTAFAWVTYFHLCGARVYLVALSPDDVRHKSGWRIYHADSGHEHFLASSDPDELVKKLDLSSRVAFIIMGHITSKRLELFRKVKARAKNVGSCLLMTNVRTFSNMCTNRVECEKWVDQDRVKVFGVSKWHADYFNSKQKMPRGGKAVYLYNPVSTYMDPVINRLACDLGLVNQLVVDKNKLIYVSALGKGLQTACDVLSAIVKIRPSTRLVVFTPMYSNSSKGKATEVGKCLAVKDRLDVRPSVEIEELAREVKTSFAVLYPTFYKETFGMALVEANCLGTPVLGDAVAALPEVLSAANSLLPRETRSPEAYRQAHVDRLMSWYSHGRPQVSCPDWFHIDKVLQPLLEAFRVQ